MQSHQTSVSEPGALTGVRRTADIGFEYVAMVFVAAVLVQVFLAGMGVFGIDAPTPEGSSFDAHRTWGFALGGLAVILLILALVARQSRRTMVAALVLFLLVFIAQSALASAGESVAWAGGLHALDGVLILLLSVLMALGAWRRRQGR